MTIYVLDKGDAQNRGAAPVRGLDKFPGRIPVPVKQDGEYPDKNDAYKGDEKTEQYIFGVPNLIKIRGGNILKKQNRKSDFVIKGI